MLETEAGCPWTQKLRTALERIGDVKVITENVDLSLEKSEENISGMISH